jgi:hypothetical protein
MMTFVDVKKAIDTWDPIELLKINAPSDEYDIESKKIYDSIKLMSNITQIGQVIYKVFYTMFGKKSFDKSLDECLEIAKIIKEEVNI